MFGRKKKAQKREEHQQSLRKGLLFWLPGGSSRLDVYVDYCVIRCLGKTKMKEKERVIPFTSIQDVVYTPPTAMRLACLQLITKEMPDVKKILNWGDMMAASALVVVPSVIFFMFIQNKIAGGMTEGAVK